MSIRKEQIINLAAMECGSSCIMTFLNSKGYNYKSYLLNYWNLNYYSQVLMASKNIRKTNLEFLYGIEMSFNKGDTNSIKTLLLERKVVLLLTKVNVLDYFPKDLQIFDHNKFKHTVMLMEYKISTDEYVLIDPIVEFIGKITTEELEKNLSIDRDFYYYVLHENPSFNPPAKSEIFKKTVKSNFDIFINSKVNEGVKAIEKFSSDLSKSLLWQKDIRNSWIEHNNITISSIIKTRKFVWKSICELEIMTKYEEQSQELLFSEIMKNWNLLNFLLLKYKRNPKIENVTRLKNHIDWIKSKETEFLKNMASIGRSKR
jgi:hypothetical protein